MHGNGQVRIGKGKDRRHDPGSLEWHQLEGGPPDSEGCVALHGQYAVRVNDQYRIVFRFEGSDAFDVRCTDYH